MEFRQTDKSVPVRSSLLRKFPDGAAFICCIVMLAFVLFVKDGYSLILICGILSMIFLVMISAADIKTGLIPDQFTAGLFFSALFWMAYDIFLVQAADKQWYEVFTTRLAGGLIGGALMLITCFAGKLLLKKESVGMGDVKLMFACGAIVDLKGIIAVYMLSFLLAFIPAIIGIIKRHKGTGTLPFAPFISAAVMITLIFPAETALIASAFGVVP